MSDDEPTVEELREALKQLGWGQRETVRRLQAERLHINEGEFRAMCRGQKAIPRMVLLALKSFAKGAAR